MRKGLYLRTPLEKDACDYLFVKEKGGFWYQTYRRNSLSPFLGTVNEEVYNLIIVPEKLCNWS